jgi:hypothetical protein
MILLLKKLTSGSRPSLWGWLFVFALGWCVPGWVLAQEGQRLSVTPALFEMSAVPGQVWNSSIRVVNPNQYPLTVYIEPVLFTPRGEGGDGILIPESDVDESVSSLARWITVSREPIEISPEQTQNIPFTVAVPNDAPPGGHFAAFTVSTRPPEGAGKVTELRTAQVVTSLFFVRVAGEVVEAGSIRDFFPERRFVTTPTVTLSLRFENDGNVHIRPQGDILITNMWGQERGVIPINRQSHFGNVLPDSVRKFSFTWSGDLSLSDIGRYEASVTLAYGTEARQFVTSSTHFWVIPVVPVMITLSTLVSIVLLTIWLVRSYVRRMLLASGYRPVPRRPIVRAQAVIVTDLMVPPTGEVVPVAKSGGLGHRLSVRDLVHRSMAGFVALYRYGLRLCAGMSERSRAIIVGALLISLVLVVGYFIAVAREEQRLYEIAYEDQGSSTTISSDQIEFESRKSEIVRNQTVKTFENRPLAVAVVNKSGVAGLGATVGVLLETAGYTVESVRTELGAAQGRTIIIYDPQLTEEALALSAQFNNAPLSAFATPGDATALIEIHVGKDLVSGLSPQ